jgi:cullin-associated NEDD8-dissociated protein 1
MESYLPAVNLSILLDHIIRGITDDSHEIRIVNFLMLQRLARTSPTVLSHRLEDLIAPLKETLLFKPKANAVKLEIERSKELAVAAARTCYVLAKLESSKFSSFLEDTRNSSTFLAEIFGNIAMEPSTSSMFKTLDITDL